MAGARHTVQLHIDSRELKLCEKFREWFPEGSPHIIMNKQLPVGDIQFVVDEKPALIIERKTAQDLHGSMSGKHLREQLAGMIVARQQNPAIGLCFVIEGDLAQVYYPPNTRVTYSSMNKYLNQMYPKYQISVVRLKDVTETRKWLGEIQETFLKKGSPEYILSLVTPADRVIVGNKRKVEPSFFLQTTLSLVSGMSPERAKLVADHYQTLPKIMAAYTALTTVKEREQMLKSFQVPGQKTHLGPELSAKVYYNLHGIVPEAKKPAAKRRTVSANPPKQAKIKNVGGHMKFQ